MILVSLCTLLVELSALSTHLVSQSFQSAKPLRNGFYSINPEQRMPWRPFNKHQTYLLFLWVYSLSTRFLYKAMIFCWNLKEPVSLPSWSPRSASPGGWTTPKVRKRRLKHVESTTLLENIGKLVSPGASSNYLEVFCPINITFGCKSVGTGMATRPKLYIKPC